MDSEGREGDRALSFQFPESEIKQHIARTGHRQYTQMGFPPSDIWTCTDCVQRELTYIRAVEFMKRLPEIEAALIEGIAFVIHHQFEELNERFGEISNG